MDLVYAWCSAQFLFNKNPVALHLLPLLVFVLIVTLKKPSILTGIPHIHYRVCNQTGT